MMSASSQASESPSRFSQSRLKHIWTVTGPAGVGKSTVGEGLSKKLGLPYIEGDEYHPPTNVDKMRSGHPLTDDDRWDWLSQLGLEAVKRLSSPESGINKAASATATSSRVDPPFTSTAEPQVQPPHAQGVILTCSALKKKYRDVLREATRHHAGLRIHFIYLHANLAEIVQRVRARQGHFMGEDMVESQYASLEEPRLDETDCIVVDVSETSPVQVVEIVLAKIQAASLQDK